MSRIVESRQVEVPVGAIVLQGDLVIPDEAAVIVLFAHGSGSSRLSPRNRSVADRLNKAGLATLLFDLLTVEEEEAERWTRHLRFDIKLLTERLVGATDWALKHTDTLSLPIGYFGASTGAAAALCAATRQPTAVKAIVSRGGRPDLAMPVLDKVKAPTLLIVGGKDYEVINLNRRALARLKTIKKLEIIPGATHLFEEEGALEDVAELSIQWFERYLI